MPRHNQSCQPSCECRGCQCPDCPTSLKAVKDIDPSVCDHGTRPKCLCNAVKSNDSCELCIPVSCIEPEPVSDPERIQSLMKVVTSALRADVHRYLGIFERIEHDKDCDEPFEDKDCDDTPSHCSGASTTGRQTL
ncbi:uncharacterized protein LOC125229442 isoform X2 [Leguminivora glycinivorella]|uniref:uncharacterized protein LOC125229442 isoform X2 n=1 Tax=Leguminivora glycinivorella TaxID=1035111 RepID=UPI00200CC39C|nr:uncharacterized protein LOC125229442 isoform X2 [Leguminivora glycinivorella]